MKRLLFINVALLIFYIISNLLIIRFTNSFLRDNYVGEYQNYSFHANVDVINLGTSHGSSSFNWETLNDVKGVNFGRAGQPVSYELELLKHYENYIDENTLIIVILSLHTFCMDQSSFTDLDAVYGDGFPLFGFVRTSKIYYLFESLLFGRPFPKDNYDGGFSPNRVSDEFWNCSDSQQQEVIDNLLSISDSFKNVVFLTTPRYLPTNQDKDYYFRFYENVNKVLDLSGREYYDYSFDSRFNNIDYFYNSHHLNTNGRAFFTNIVFHEIIG